MSGYGGWLLAANSLEEINEDLGPSPNYLWMPLANTIGSAVGMILFGRLSDIFGRRWFMIASNVLVLVGSLVAATTTAIEGIIAANCFIGLGGAAQLSYGITLAELVPHKARGYVSCVVFVAALPVNAFGPIVAKSLIAHTSQTWRWCYYLNIITTFCATVSFALFYHPPSFGMLHAGKTKTEQLKSLDYGGLILMLAGLILTLLGLNWGGSMYPWNSGHVIGTLAVGLSILVAFVVYEFHVPQDPIIPPSLMKNVQCMLIIGVACVGGMIYYGMSVFWPSMVSNLFTDDLEYQGWLSMTSTAGAALGNIVAGACFALGKFRWQLIVATSLLTTFFGAMSSVDQDTLSRGIAFSVIGTFFAGWLEGPTMAAITFTVDQADIGLAVGLLNSIRVCFGAIAVAIYTTVQSSRELTLQAIYIPQAALGAGLPSSSIPELSTTIQDGGLSANLENIPGMNSNIIAAVKQAGKHAYAGGCDLVFLVIISFGALSLILSFLIKNVDEFLTNKVSRQLQQSTLWLGKKHDEEDNNKAEALHIN